MFHVAKVANLNDNPLNIVGVLVRLRHGLCRVSPLRSDWLFLCDFYWNIKGHHGIYEQNGYSSFNVMVQKQLLKKKLTITLKAEDLFDSSKLNDVKRVNFVVQNRKVNNFNRCIIASISYNFNSFKDKYNGSGSAEDEINRF